MVAVKEKIIDAVTVMSDAEAEMIWEHILKKFNRSWDDIEEDDPDAFDMQMLEDIKNDPECHQFTKESDIVWNKD